MNEPNYAVNQRIRDTKNPPTEMCRRIGMSHAAYGWSKKPDGQWIDECKAAYIEGYDQYVKDHKV